MANNPLEDFVHRMFHVAARAEFEPLSDQELLVRYVGDRNELAFGALVHRHRTMVWRVCERILGHSQDAEDAFQVTFLTLIKKAASLIRHESINGWLYTSAHHIATKARMARARRRDHEKRRAEMRREDYWDAHQKELGEVLDMELTRLPERLRSPLILCYLEGVSRERAAQRLGIPVRTLDSRLIQGREQMQAKLAKRGIEFNATILHASLAPAGSLHEIPSGLVEKTLSLVRILTLSNGAVESATLSPQVAVLMKGMMSAWSLKVKICLGVLLLTLAGVGAGVAKYPGFFLQLLRGDQAQENQADPVNKKTLEPQAIQIPPRIDRDGDPLPPGALDRLGTRRFRHNGEQFATLIVTPDKRNPLIVSNVAHGGQLRLWDFSTGKPLYHFPDSQRQAIPVPTVQDGKNGQTQATWAISLNGQLLAKCDKLGGEFHFWDMSTRQLLKIRVKEHLQCLAISSDGISVATMSEDCLCGWDSRTGEQKWSCKVEKHRYSELVYSSDGKTLMSLAKASRAKNKKTSVCRWSEATGQKLAPWIIADRVISDCAWSGDGSLLAVVTEGRGNTIQLWNMDTGKLVRQIGVDGEIERQGIRFALSPNGGILATGACNQGKKGAIGLWNTATGQKLRDCSNGSSWLDRLAFSADGQRLVVTSIDDNTIQVYEVASGEQVNREWLNRGPRTEIRSVAFSPRDRTWVSTTSIHNPTGSFENFQQVVISPDGRILAAIVKVADVTGKSGTYSVRHKTYLWHVHTSEDGLRLERSRLLTKLESDLDNCNTLSFSPDSRLLATSGSFSPIIHVWEIATGQERYRFNDHGFASLNSCPLSFSSDGRRLASGHKDTTILIWDLTGRSDGKQLYPAWLSAQKMEARWADLATVDAAQAARALWSMVAAGSPTIFFLGKQLRPIRGEPALAETVTNCTADLNYDILAVRQRTRSELKKFGEAAEPNLSQALDNNPSLTIRCGIDELPQAVEKARSLLLPLSSEVLRQLRAIEVLEQIGTPEARQLLEELSRGDAGVPQTRGAQAALGRLQQRASDRKSISE